MGMYGVNILGQIHKKARSTLHGFSISKRKHGALPRPQG